MSVVVRHMPKGLTREKYDDVGRRTQSRHPPREAAAAHRERQPTRLLNLIDPLAVPF